MSGFQWHHLLFFYHFKFLDVNRDLPNKLCKLVIINTLKEQYTQKKIVSFDSHSCFSKAARLPFISGTPKEMFSWISGFCCWFCLNQSCWCIFEHTVLKWDWDLRSTVEREIVMNDDSNFSLFIYCMIRFNKNLIYSTQDGVLFWCFLSVLDLEGVHPILFQCMD